MSLYAANAFGYLQQVEAYFLSQTRVGVMLSSKDAELMRHYRDSAVPVEVVCLGIKRAFEQYAEPPRSIYQCRRAVEQEIQAWRRRQVGRHVGEGVVAEILPAASGLPGRDLPDPTDPNRRRRRRGVGPPPVEEAAPPVEAEAVPAEREPCLAAWFRSMERLIELGRGCGDEHILRCYRWAYKEMVVLKMEAEGTEDKDHVAAMLPLAVGEIEAAMYDQLYNSLHPDLRDELDRSLPPQMHRALRAMSPPAARRQLRVWRRRLLEDRLNVLPFFTP